MWPWQQRLISSLKSERYQKVFETGTSLLNMTSCVDEWIKWLVCKRTKTKHVFMEIPVLHNYWSVHSSKHNGSHQCQTKHMPYSLRCRRKFTGELERDLFPTLPSLSTFLLCFPFSSHSAGKSRIWDCSHVPSVIRPKTGKTQCCEAVWMCILYLLTPTLVSPAQHTPIIQHNVRI